jgi:hypothetical protein
MIFVVMKYAPASGPMAPSNVLHLADSGRRLDARCQPRRNSAREASAERDTPSGEAIPSDVGWVVVVDEQGRHCLWPACEPLPEGCCLSDGLDPRAPSGAV